MKALIKVTLHVVWKREQQKIIALYSIQAKRTYKIVANKQTKIKENGQWCMNGWNTLSHPFGLKFAALGDAIEAADTSTK